jgi:hypothetical protein
MICLVANQMGYADTDLLITVLNHPSFKQRNVNDGVSAQNFMTAGPRFAYPDKIAMYRIRKNGCSDRLCL